MNNKKIYYYISSSFIFESQVQIKCIGVKLTIETIKLLFW